MQAAGRSTIDLARVQHVRKAVLLAATALAVLPIVFGDSVWPGGSGMHEAVEWAGFALILLCILGRTWSSLYISGRKVRTDGSLVTFGPYSVTRNPLYLFSIVGAVGAGAQLGSIVAAVAAGLLAAIVFHLVVLKEERLMLAKLGAEYRQYLATVPRFLPRPALWRDLPKVDVHPGMVVRTFADACVFLLSIPLAEGFEYLHEAGILPTLFHLF